MFSFIIFSCDNQRIAGGFLVVMQNHSIAQSYTTQFDTKFDII